MANGSDGLAATLRQFFGGGDYTRYRPFGQKSELYLTEGVKYLADRGACWWLIDIICSYQPTCRKDPMLREAQYWTVKVKGDKSATVTCSRDTDDVAIVQEIESTDFPLPEQRIWVEIGSVDGENVCYIAMLPNEH